jgi:hypothetical protein
LNLFQLSASFVTEAGARTPQIMGRDLAKFNLTGIFANDMPDYPLGNTVAPHCSAPNPLDDVPVSTTAQLQRSRRLHKTGMSRPAVEVADILRAHEAAFWTRIDPG